MTDYYSSPSIVWFRNDQRLSDNPALREAAKHQSMLPVFIWAPDEESPWEPGGASRWWLHRSLQELNKSLKEKNSFLYIDKGPTLGCLEKLAQNIGASAIYWNRHYEPKVIVRDKEIKTALTKKDLLIKSFKGSVLNEPWEVLKKNETPYQVYTPYWKVAHPKIAIEKNSRISIPAPPSKITSPHTVAELALNPQIAWDGGLTEFWQPGEEQAQKLLKSFVKQAVEDYEDDRNIPSIEGTSFMSPYLHFGNISPRQIWQAVKKKNANKTEQFLKEVVWRDFAVNLIYHFPYTDKEPLRDAFKKFPWRKSKKHLKAWQQGMTGFPIVDAGMRQLYHIGWMHNRVRMIVASFLVKDLQIKWQEGARWFWDTLVDADLASNSMGWQWAAGSGADAAPYFRVFNPMLQGSRFDPDGKYIREWIPELSDLPNKWIHEPWEAPADELKKAGIVLGETYPEPLVDHAHAKRKALAAYETIKSKKN